MIVIDAFYAIVSALGFSSFSNNPAASGTPEPSRTHNVSQSMSGDNIPYTSLDWSVPDSILAFRSITLILSQLQNHPEIPYVQCRLSQQEDKEAKIDNVFAHLTVSDHDVVAITTQCTLEALDIVAISERTSEEGEDRGKQKHQSRTPHLCKIGA